MRILADRHESPIRQARERFGAAIDRPARHLRRRALCLGARKTGSVAPDGVIALISHQICPVAGSAAIDSCRRGRASPSPCPVPAAGSETARMRPPVRAHREGDDIAAIAEQREPVAVRPSLHPQRRIAAERRIAAAQLGTAEIGQRSQPPARRIGGVEIDTPHGQFGVPPQQRQAFFPRPAGDDQQHRQDDEQHTHAAPHRVRNGRHTPALPERTITGAFRVGSTRLGQRHPSTTGRCPPHRRRNGQITDGRRPMLKTLSLAGAARSP